MRTSEELDKLSEALASAQGEIQTVSLNKVNPHFKSKYADLSAIREASKDPLSKHGIALVQSPSFADGRVVITTRLIHKSGQWIESELTIKPERGDTPQAIGSAITYGRRYGLAAMLGIVADEDDDGNAASAPKQQMQPVRQQQPAPQHPRPVALPQPPKIFNRDNPDWMVWLRSGLKHEMPGVDFPDVDWFLDRLHGKEIIPGVLREAVAEKQQLDIEG